MNDSSMASLAKAREDAKAIEPIAMARIILSSKMRYFTAMLWRCILVETDKVDTMACDRFFRIYYNAEYTKKIRLEELCAQVGAALTIILMGWHQRGENKENKAKWTKSCTISAYDLLEESLTNNRFAIPSGEPTIEQYKKYGLEKGMSPEEIYDKLPDDPGDEGGIGMYGPWEQGAPSADNPGVNPGAADVIRRNVADAIAKNPGNTPGGLKRWAESVLTEIIPWQKVLHSLVKGVANRVKGDIDFTFSIPHRRTGIWRPGKNMIIMPSMISNKIRVGVVIDQSGSTMFDGYNERALAEVRAVIKAVGGDEGIQVCSCDAAASQVKKAFSIFNVDLIGGGGTDMRIGVDAILSSRMPRPHCIIIITDGYTPWPAEPIAGCLLIALVVGGKEHSTTDGIPGFIKILEVDL